MKWNEGPIGMLRLDDLLNGLLAISRAHQAARPVNAAEVAGFEAALESVALFAGVAKEFSNLRPIPIQVEVISPCGLLEADHR